MADIVLDITDALDHYRKQIGNPSMINVNEIEFRPRSFIDLRHFATMKKFMDERYGDPEIQWLLDIIYTKEGMNHRVRIIDDDEKLPNIQTFCVSRSVPNNPYVETITKKKVNYDTPYRTRVGVSLEQTVSRDNATKFVEDYTKKRTYRYQKRYRYKLSEYASVDLSVVKQSGSVASKFSQSGALESQEHYEVEIEYSGTVTDETDLESIAKTLKPGLTLLYRTLYDSMIVVPQEDIDDAKKTYEKLTGGKTFVGADVVTMKTSDIQNVTKQIDDNPVYWVTDKTDGERTMCYIDNEGRIYFFGRSMNFNYTGYESVEFANSIIDGELLHVNNRYLFMAFDILFHNNRDVRETEFYERYESLFSENKDKFAQSIVDARPDLNDELYLNSIDFDSKRYVEYKSATLRDEMFKKFAISLGSNMGETRVYERAKKNITIGIDGLIFQPARTQISNYPKVKPQKNVWPFLYKWKPISMLSVDFKVEFMEIVDGESLGINDNYKYQKMRLYVGVGSRLEEFNASPFAYAKIDDDLPRTSEGVVINNSNIVECIYLPQQDKQYWVPIRIRFDKSRPNMSLTAKNNWISIQHPVTVEVLTNGELADQYYDNSSSHRMFRIKKAHNAIKGFLIESVVRKANKRPRVLDLACGRGNDIHKWSRQKLSYYLGVDQDPGNIVEARQRYKQFGKGKPMNYIQGDVLENLSTLPQLSDALKERFDIVTSFFAIHYMYGNEDGMKMLLGNITNNIKQGGYVVFTTFYDKSVMDLFESGGNKNGVFIDDKDDRVTGFMDSGVVWSLKRKFKDLKKPYGNELAVYNSSISQISGDHYAHLVEYLIPHENLIQECAKRGLVLQKQGTIAGNKPISAGFSEYRAHIGGDKLNSMEQAYSNLNYVYVFKFEGPESYDPLDNLKPLMMLKKEMYPIKLPRVKAPRATVIRETEKPKKGRVAGIFGRKTGTQMVKKPRDGRKDEDADSSRAKRAPKKRQ